MRDRVTVSPGITVRSGPGDATVDEVKPQPAGVTILPKRAKEAGVARRRLGVKANPRSAVAARRHARTNGLTSRSKATVNNLL